MKKTTLLFFILLSLHSLAQQDSAVYFKGAATERRARDYKTYIHIVNRNLSTALCDSTEDEWISAFEILEVLQYKSPWIDHRIALSVDSIQQRSTYFQHALLELIYVSYPDIFSDQVHSLAEHAQDAKSLALCAEYLLQSDTTVTTRQLWSFTASAYLATHAGLTAEDSTRLEMLVGRCLVPSDTSRNRAAILTTLLSPVFLPGKTVVFSFQRKNRNYPGIVIIRDTAGHFLTLKNGQLFAVPQLARSVSGLPFYLTNGNTPQGIFKMDGLEVSRLDALGPTPDIQLRLPFETSVADFLSDTTWTDSIWSMELYQCLLPPDIRNYFPLSETYYAGKAGRTEIIAHGTTVDPRYYLGKPYYPYTPTEGCLCTKEIWSEEDGRRLISDQQQLVDALKRAGSATGYYIVLDIDDRKAPVSLEDIRSYLPR